MHASILLNATEQYHTHNLPKHGNEINKRDTNRANLLNRHVQPNLNPLEPGPTNVISLQLHDVLTPPHSGDDSIGPHRWEWHQ